MQYICFVGFVDVNNTVITIMHGQDTKGSHTSVSPDTYLSYLGCLIGNLLKVRGGGGGEKKRE